MRIIVTGAGGFIGHHLVNRLKADGHYVKGVDIKHPEFAPTQADEFLLEDLRFWSDAIRGIGGGFDEVYHLAADMGGIGYITSRLAQIARNNALINLQVLETARTTGVKRMLFSSSACVYPASAQSDSYSKRLRERDAIPADPEPGYGWEKLFAEQLFEYYRKDAGLDCRIVRFHNVYGPLGTWRGGKEKAPAALCRKIAALPKDGGVIAVWGDGHQRRSFMYIDDCIEGLIRIMKSNFTSPLNLGTDEGVSINQLVGLIARAAGKQVTCSFDKSCPQGVRGRNSENSLLRQVLGWEPRIPLEQGLVKTYDWISQQVSSAPLIQAPLELVGSHFMDDHAN